MSDNREEGALVLVIIAAAVGAVAWLVWSFSEALGVDPGTGGRVFAGLVLVAGFMGAAWWTSGFGILGFRGSWPIGLGLVWMAFWPALNVWGALTPAAFMGVDPELAWWAAWYSKALGLVILVGGGWWLNSFLEDRY